MELAVVQVQVREDPVFLEHVVAKPRCVEEIGMTQLAQLLVAAHEEEHLRRERVAPRILVEVLEEGILLRLLYEQARVEALGEETRETRLPHSDDPFDRDVTSRKVLPLARQDQNRPSFRTGGFWGSFWIILRMVSPDTG